MDLTCRDEVRAAAVNANVASESPIIQLRYDPFTESDFRDPRVFLVLSRHSLTPSLPLLLLSDG